MHHIERHTSVPKLHTGINKKNKSSEPGVHGGQTSMNDMKTAREVLTPEQEVQREGACRAKH